MIDLQKAFEAAADEYIQFERIQSPRHERPDICAFLLLCELVPSKRGRDFIGSAGHDEIWLDVDCDELAKVATQEHIIELVRCGVRYDSENDSLAMFV